jgi:hypothetical protein
MAGACPLEGLVRWGPQNVAIQSLTNSGLSVARRNFILLISTIPRSLLSYQASLACASTTIAIDQLNELEIRSN